MRITIAAASAALLAGCQVPETPQENGGASEAVIATPDSSSGSPINTEAAAEASNTASAPAPAVPVRAGSIPPVFHGRYDESRAACARPSEYRLVITASELRFHESIGKVRGVAVEGPVTASVTADYRGEEESWSNTRQLLLSKDNGSIMISGDGTAITRIRCQ